MLNISPLVLRTVIWCVRASWSCYWNTCDSCRLQDCHTPKDPKGKKRCQWTPTKEDVDCTILWKTKDKKGKSLDDESMDIDDIHFIWITKSNELLYRVENTMKWVEDTVKVPISLMASIVLIIAAIIACKLWKCWTEESTKCGDGFSGDEGFGYSKIGDVESTDHSMRRYGACSGKSRSNHYQSLWSYGFMYHSRWILINDILHLLSRFTFSHFYCFFR